MKSYDLYSYNGLEKNEFWRTLIGFFLFILIVFFLYGGGLFVLSRLEHTISLKHQKLTTLLLFTSFTIWHIALFFVVFFIHRRSYFSLVGVCGKISGRHFVRAFLVTMLISLFALIIIPFESFFFEEKYLPDVEMVKITHWVRWVVPAIIVIFIQISAEELLFRGYLLQQFIARFKSFWIWAIVPSILFGAGHFDFHSFGYNTYFYMANATVFGVMASILTVKSKNISYALGMHFFNNVTGVLLLGLGDSLSGLALINYYFDKTGIYMTYIIISQSILHMITFLILYYWIKKQKN